MDGTQFSTRLHALVRAAMAHAVHYLARRPGRLAAFVVAESAVEPMMPPRDDPSPDPHRGVLYVLGDGPEGLRDEVRMRRERLDAYAIGWAAPLKDPESGELIDAIFVEAGEKGEGTAWLHAQPYVVASPGREFLPLGSVLVVGRRKSSIG